jgi:hypothetical protein
VGVKVKVGDGVWDGVAEGVGVKVGDGVWDGVGDGVWDGVAEGVGVKVKVGDGVWDGVAEGVGVKVGDGVLDGVAEGVGGRRSATAYGTALRGGAGLRWSDNDRRCVRHFWTCHFNEHICCARRRTGGCIAIGAHEDGRAVNTDRSTQSIASVGVAADQFCALNPGGCSALEDVDGAACRSV